MMNKRAEGLIKQLNELRDEETEFVKDLESKYGPGKLNPFTLIYDTKENENS
jgi:ribosomal protein S24E